MCSHSFIVQQATSTCPSGYHLDARTESNHGYAANFVRCQIHETLWRIKILFFSVMCWLALENTPRAPWGNVADFKRLYTVILGILGFSVIVVAVVC